VKKNTANQLGDEARPIASPWDPSAALPVRDYVAQFFGVQRGGIGTGVFPGEWGAVGMLGILSAAYFAASYLALRFLRHQQR
jgi:hypothetical protein